MPAHTLRPSGDVSAQSSHDQTDAQHCRNYLRLPEPQYALVLSDISQRKSYHHRKLF